MTPAAKETIKLRATFLKKYLVNRSDVFGIERPWGEDGAAVAPAIPFLERGPAERIKNEEASFEDNDPESRARRAGRAALILGHLLGPEAPPVFLAVKKKGGSYGVVGPGHYRIGCYAPGADGKTKWACVDFDGAGHAQGHALSEPRDAAMMSHEELTEHGIRSFLECSRSGQGWHLWILFAKPRDVESARRLGLLAVPGGWSLEGGEPADAAHGKGIAVFPKGTKGELGSLVWAPWFHGSAAGTNVFYRMVGHTDVQEVDPWVS
jgi:hypothetical protein